MESEQPNFIKVKPDCWAERLHCKRKPLCAKGKCEGQKARNKARKINNLAKPLSLPLDSGWVSRSAAVWMRHKIKLKKPHKIKDQHFLLMCWGTSLKFWPTHNVTLFLSMTKTNVDLLLSSKIVVLVLFLFFLNACVKTPCCCPSESSLSRAVLGRACFKYHLWASYCSPTDIRTYLLHTSPRGEIVAVLFSEDEGSLGYAAS